MKKRIWLIVVAAFVVVIVVSAIIVQKNKNRVRRTEVTIEAAQIRNLVLTVSATGAIEPVTQVKISAEIPGRITELTVKEGNHVEKDQFLVQLDPETYRAALKSATSGLRSRAGRK